MGASGSDPSPLTENRSVRPWSVLPDVCCAGIGVSMVPRVPKVSFP